MAELNFKISIETLDFLENGPIIATTSNEKLALCRCGHSENKPYCDGKHKGKFEAPEAHIVLAHVPE